MKNNAIWGLTLSLALVSSAVVATAVVRDFDDPVVQKDDKDKAKQEKELAELEAQKAKLEARIGELRKKTGKSAR